MKIKAKHLRIINIVLTVIVILLICLIANSILHP